MPIVFTYRHESDNAPLELRSEDVRRNGAESNGDEMVRNNSDDSPSMRNLRQNELKQSPPGSAHPYTGRADDLNQMGKTFVISANAPALDEDADAEGVAETILMNNNAAKDGDAMKVEDVFCAFCKTSTQNPVEMGDMLENENLSAHHFCMVNARRLQSAD